MRLFLPKKNKSLVSMLFVTLVQMPVFAFFIFTEFVPGGSEMFGPIVYGVVGLYSMVVLVGAVLFAEWREDETTDDSSTERRRNHRFRR